MGNVISYPIECDGILVPFPPNSSLVPIAFSISCLGISLSFGGNLFIYVFRHKPVMQVSQRAFMHCYCAGWAFVNVGGLVGGNLICLCFLYSLLFTLLLYQTVLNSYPPFRDSLCMLQLATVHLALSFIISVFTIKEWRTWKIRLFTAEFKRFKMTG